VRRITAEAEAVIEQLGGLREPAATT
jgi:hypothetical protein